MSNSTLDIYEIPFTKNIGQDVSIHLLTILISIITTFGGVGGGGLITPLIMLILDYEIDDAIPITVCVMFGSALIRTLYFYFQSHPLCAFRTLMYFPPLIILTPFISNGSFIGIILSEIMPNLIKIIIILLLLGYTFYKTLKKGLKKLKNEKNTEPEIVNNISKNGDKQRDINKYLIILLFSPLIIGIFSITRKYIELCSSNYYIQVSIQFLLVLIIGFFSGKFILFDYNKKININYYFVRGDIIWNLNKIIKMAFFGTIIGIMTSFIGIGGGLIVNPLLLQYNVHSYSVIATGVVVSTISTSMSIINFIIINKLKYYFGLTLMFCSLFGSMIGIFLLKKYKKKIKEYIFIFTLAFLVLASCILLTINTFISEDISDFSLSNYCKS